MMTPPPVTRRGMLAGAAAVGASTFLAACASDDEPSHTPVTLAAASVPVGGGTILREAEVVVTQPTEGVYKAFSAVCTHQRCIVKEVVDSRIHCICHNSYYSVTDGSVQDGPAPQPLPPRTVTKSGDILTIT